MRIRSSGLLAVAMLAAPSAFAQFAECEAHFHEGRLEAAIASCGAAVQSDPEHARAWTLRGLARHAAGQSQEALQDLDRALGIDPRNVAALEVRADIHAARGDASAALRDLGAAAAAEPGNARVLMALAAQELRAGQREQAAATLQRAAKADKRSAEPWLRLAQITPEPRKRMDHLSKAVKADKTHVDALRLRAQAYLDAQELRKAVRDLRAALALEPGGVDLRLALASVLLQQKSPKEALAVIDQGLAQQGESQLRELRVHANLADGNAVAAFDDLHALHAMGASAPEPLVDAVAAAIDARYAPGASQAVDALAALAFDASSRCDVAPSESVLLEALARHGGRVEAAEAQLRKHWRDTLGHCLVRAEPPPTDRFAEARRVIGEYGAVAASASQRLEQDCAPYTAQPQCAAVAADMRGKPAQMMEQLRALEQRAAQRRTELAGLRDGAEQTVNAALTASQRQLGASARRYFDERMDARRRDAAFQYFRTATVADVGSVCPVPQQRASDINQPDRANRETREYSQCLQNFEARLETQREMDAHAETLQVQRLALDVLASYRCSQRRAASGCVPDEVWTRNDAALPKARVDAALALWQRRSGLLNGGLDALLVARNDYIDGINRRIDEIEAQRDREEQARAFAQGLQAIADSLNQSQQGYRRDSSTSAPGMR